MSAIKNQKFLTDVIYGLRKESKSISSKYFYDEKGDEIFQQIMQLDEYYLSRAEYEIFENKKQEILQMFSPNGQPFNLVEFGAGDGFKTKILLNHFVEKEADFDYFPIDISQNALDGLEANLSNEIPRLNVKALQGDYFEVLERLSHSSDRQNVVMFLGSNIGNFNSEEALEFLTAIRMDLNPGDLFLIGIDLIKDPDKILSAYDDSLGVTAEFNLNLLERINCELGGNFEKDKFRHHVNYNPMTGICMSSLISLQDQEVKVANQIFAFSKWESIRMEISKKYSPKEIDQLAIASGFNLITNYTDPNEYFINSLWRV